MNQLSVMFIHSSKTQFLEVKKKGHFLDIRRPPFLRHMSTEINTAKCKGSKPKSSWQRHGRGSPLKQLVPLKYLSYPSLLPRYGEFSNICGSPTWENINSHDMWKQRDLQGIWWSVSKHVSNALLAKSVTMFFFDAFGASVFERDGQSFIKSLTIGKLPAFAATCKVFLHGFRGFRKDRDLGMYILNI